MSAYHRYTYEIDVCDECFSENKNESVEIRNKKQPIFHFVADCGGDRLNLCKKHLQEALNGLLEGDKNE